MNTFYNNTIKKILALPDMISDNQWMYQNKSQGEQIGNIIYGSSALLSSKYLPAVLDDQTKRGIIPGYAYSSVNEVLKVITYNAGKPEGQKIKFVVSEIEPYNTGKYAEMTATLTEVYKLCKKNNLKNIVYMGWPHADYWTTLLQYSDEINLHCYLKSNQMTPDTIYNYCRKRLDEIAVTAVKIQKKAVVNIIYSCEPEFSYDWFKAHQWKDAHDIFKLTYAAKANPAMRSNIQIGGYSIFVTSFAKQIKPLINV